MSSRLYDAFEVCLAALDTGVELETCLLLYPDLSGELRPILLTAQNARKAGQAVVPKAAMNRSRAQFLTQAASLRSSRRPFVISPAFPRLAMAALAAVIVLFLSLNGLVVASAKSLPGDTLYPVKRAAESVSLGLTRNVETRQQLEENYQHRRTEEIRGLLEKDRVHKISLEGIVSEDPAGGLVVNGIPVRVKAGATVIGDIVPGRVVEVEGETQPGGWIDATELHLRFFERAGALEATESGWWTIGGSRFKILPTTRIDPALKTGDQVLVLVYSADDGMLYAQAILRLPAELMEDTGFEPFEVEFEGQLEAVSGDELIINGKTVRISEQTEINAALTTGALLKLHVVVSPDGSLTATEITAYTQEVRQTDADDRSDREDEDDQDDSSDDSDTGDDHGSDEDGEEDGSGRSEDGGDEDDDSGNEGDNSGDDVQDPGGDDDNSGEDDDSGGDDEDSSGKEDDSDDDEEDSSDEDDEPDDDDSNSDSGADSAPGSGDSTGEK